MWLFTKLGFYSIVAHKDDPHTVLIRARAREDLERLQTFYRHHDERSHLAQADIHESDTSDYRFRIFARRADFDTFMILLAIDLDYTNFKDEIHKQGDAPRDTAYMNVWVDMRNFQNRKDTIRNYRVREQAGIEGVLPF